MRTLTTLLAALSLVACGASQGPDGSPDEGQVITVPCVDGTATQAFPSESWEEIEATVWYVGPVPANPPAGYRPGALAPISEHAIVTDGQAAVMCLPKAFISTTDSEPTVAVELFERP